MSPKTKTHIKISFYFDLGHTQKCSQIVPGSVFRNYFWDLRKPHGMPGIKIWSAGHKTAILTTLLSLQFLILNMLLCSIHLQIFTNVTYKLDVIYYFSFPLYSSFLPILSLLSPTTNNLFSAMTWTGIKTY